MVTNGRSVQFNVAKLGHATITMTMRYAHLSPGGLSALDAPKVHKVAATM
jgi:hypothetical protein